MNPRSNGSLSGLRVHVLRGGQWGDAVAERIRDRGGKAVITELLRIEGPPDPEELVSAAASWNRGSHELLVMTSANAVEAFISAGGAPRVGGRVAAVGPATAEALRGHGFAVDLVPKSMYSAEGLAAELLATLGVAHGPGGSSSSVDILLPISEIADDALEGALRNAGHRVLRVTAYRTVAMAPSGDPFVAVEDVCHVSHGGGVSAALRNVMLVTSSSAALAVAEHLTPLPTGTVLAAIGDPTARALHRVGLTADVVASVHTTPGLLDALARFHDSSRPDPGQL